MTKAVKVKDLYIGGEHPITVQSMLSVPANDIEGSVKQAQSLEEAGCDIIRLAIPNEEAVRLIPAIKEKVKAPLVADIHFDYKLALLAVSAGVDKVRINPGNIGSEERVKAVAEACGNAGLPIRVGVNSGSLNKEIYEKYGAPTAEALAESAMDECSKLMKYGFLDIVVSIKSSNVKTMTDACKLFHERSDFPLHIGVTEAGTAHMGLIKNSAGIGALLLNGIGNTIRVSLTASPEEEVRAGIDILRAIGMRSCGVNLVSCPTCGRTEINLIKLANDVEKALSSCKKPLKVAVMGCIVNGPGEATEADIGIAGGRGCGLIFKKGEIIKKVPEKELLSALLDEIERM